MGLEGDNNDPTTRYNGMYTNEAILGTQIPILIGQKRIGWKLLWYGAFTSAVAQEQGGSGLAKGGAQYVYTASVIGSVCLGPCYNLLTVWTSNGRYAMESTSEPVTVPSSAPYTYTPNNQAAFKQDNGASINSSYSVTANDYGSNGNITYTGYQLIPLTYTSGAPAAGQYTVSTAPNVGPFSAASMPASSGGS